jgi:hypothetical protein
MNCAEGVLALLGCTTRNRRSQSSNGPTRRCVNVTPNVTLAYVEYRVNVALTPIHVRSNVTLAVGNVTLMPEWGPLPETWWPNLA